MEMSCTSFTLFYQNFIEVNEYKIFYIFSFPSSYNKCNFILAKQEKLIYKIEKNFSNFCASFSSVVYEIRNLFR